MTQQIHQSIGSWQYHNQTISLFKDKDRLLATVDQTTLVASQIKGGLNGTLSHKKIVEMVSENAPHQIACVFRNNTLHLFPTLRAAGSYTNC